MLWAHCLTKKQQVLNNFGQNLRVMDILTPGTVIGVSIGLLVGRHYSRKIAKRKLETLLLGEESPFNIDEFIPPNMGRYVKRDGSYIHVRDGRFLIPERVEEECFEVIPGFFGQQAESAVIGLITDIKQKGEEYQANGYHLHSLIRRGKAFEMPVDYLF